MLSRQFTSGTIVADDRALAGASFAARDEIKLIERFARHITEEQLSPHRTLDERGNLSPSQVTRYDIEWLMGHASPERDLPLRKRALEVTREIIEKISEVVANGRAPLPDPFDPPGTSYAPIRSGLTPENQAAGDELLSHFLVPVRDAEIGVAAAKELAASLEAMKKGGWYEPGSSFAGELEAALGDLIEQFRDERPQTVGGAWGPNLSECMRAWEALTGRERESYEWVKMRHFL